MYSSVTLDEAVLRAMASNRRYIELLPFLGGAFRRPKAAATGCGGCSGYAIQPSEVNQLKVQFLSLPAETLAKVKAELGTKEITINYQDGNKIKKTTV
jgi:hypothetical protein